MTTTQYQAAYFSIRADATYLVTGGLTGLGLLWYLKRVRMAGFGTLAAGGAILFMLARLAS